MRRRFASLLLLPLSLTALAGCTEPSAGGQIGGEAAECKAVATTPLAIDEDSALGFSGADVLAAVEGEHASPLEWKKGGSTTATVTVTMAGDGARYLDMEYVDDGSGAEPAIDCADVVELDVAVAFTTADGAFDESWSTALRADLADHASWHQELDLAALNGSYTVTEVNPADYDEVSVFLDVELDADGTSGEVTGQAVQSSSSGDPDGTVSAMFFPIATF